jgi:phage shock protein C
MKRLYRDKSDVRIAGVCSGIAKYLDIDPTAIRLAFVLLLFIGGGGLWIYVILWIIMPYAPDSVRDAIEVVAEEKPTQPAKIAQPKKPVEKKPDVNKAAAKKPAAKKPTAKTPAKKKTSSEKPLAATDKSEE